MSCVFQNIDPPPPPRPASVYTPAFVAGGGHTRRMERGVGSQYFGRRQTQLCTLLLSNLPILSVLYQLSPAISCFAHQFTYHSWPLFMTNLLLLVTELGLSQNPPEQASSNQKLLLFKLSFLLFHQST